MLTNTFDPIFVQSIRKRETRDKTGLTIVEGYPEVKRAYDAEVPFESLYICKEIFTPATDEFQKVDITYISKDEFAKIAFGARLKGILAICKPHPYTLSELRFKADPLIIMLEGVEKPGNLGAVLRTCDGAGVDAVIMCDGRTDVYNHNVVRSSIGTVFTVPTVAASNQEVYTYLRENSFKVFAATAHTDVIYTECDLTGPTAIIVGNEHEGLSDFWMEKADSKITIPMAGTGACLNVAMSASILTYEAVRQRS